jgi:hypothetical protein
MREIAGLLQAKGFAVTRTPTGWIAVDRYGSMWFELGIDVVRYGYDNAQGQPVEQRVSTLGFGPYDLARILSPDSVPPSNSAKP